jgi:HK97 family phage portal protein
VTSFRRIAAARKSFTIGGRTDIAFSGAGGQISHTEGIGTRAGMKVSPEGALRIAAAWIANTVIADEVSALPLKLIRRSDVARHPEQPAELRPLWDRPNPDQTSMGFWATSSLSLTLHGVSYTMLGWLNSGAIDVLWPIDPAKAVVERIDNGLRLKSPGQGELVNVAGKRPEFMMIPLYQLPGQLAPVSPVKMAAELLGLSAAYDRTVSRLMGRGMNPSAILTVGEAIDPTDAKLLSDALARVHGGADNAGGIPVVGGKDIKLERMAMTLADAEFLAQRQDVFNVTMALWRVPPTVAGMVDKPSTWGTGIAEFSRGLDRFTTRPIVLRFQAGTEAFITNWVDPDMQARFKYDAMLSATPKERAEVQRLNLQAGITSVERVLAQNDDPPFGAEETVFSQLALATAEDRQLTRLKLSAEAYAALVAAGVAPNVAAAATGFDPSSLQPAEPPA